MKTIFWNVRGVANLDTRLFIKKLCLTHKPDLLFLAEPWTDLDHFPTSFWSQLHLKPFAVNHRDPLQPNLWVICADHLAPTIIFSSLQHLIFSISVEG